MGAIALGLSRDSSLPAKFLMSLAVATVATGASLLLGLELGWVTSLNWLEIFSVFTSYSCTYLCVTQSRWNYPIGAISTTALCFLFFGQGLYGSALLNLYLAPALVYGWFRWRSDEDTRPITNLALDRWLFAYAGTTALAFGFVLWVVWLFETPLPPADAAILILSILAQFFLDNKKIITWPVWAIVNVLAIWTYWNAGLPLVAFQFVFFLANTIYGWVSWRSTMQKGTVA